MRACGCTLGALLSFLATSVWDHLGELTGTLVVQRANVLNFQPSCEPKHAEHQSYIRINQTQSWVHPDAEGIRPGPGSGCSGAASRNFLAGECRHNRGRRHGRLGRKRQTWIALPFPFRQTCTVARHAPLPATTYVLGSLAREMCERNPNHGVGIGRENQAKLHS